MSRRYHVLLKVADHNQSKQMFVCHISYVHQEEDHTSTRTNRKEVICSNPSGKKKFTYKSKSHHSHNHDTSRHDKPEELDVPKGLLGLMVATPPNSLDILKLPRHSRIALIPLDDSDAPELPRCVGMAEFHIGRVPWGSAPTGYGDNFSLAGLRGEDGK
jgi:hypothetical protein